MSLGPGGGEDCYLSPVTCYLSVVTCQKTQRGPINFTVINFYLGLLRRAREASTHQEAGQGGWFGDGEACGCGVGAPVAVVVFVADVPGVAGAGRELAGGDGQGRQIRCVCAGVEDEPAAL